MNSELQKLAYILNRSFAKPTQIILTLTNRYDPSEEQDASEFSTEKWKQILLELKEWIKGSFFVHIRGGEPFLRKDLLSLIEFASSHGIKFLVNTNGYLIDEKTAKQTAHSGLNYLVISLDGTRPETVDSIHMQEGMFAKVTEGIRYITEQKKNRMIIGISAVVMESNLDELVPLLEWTVKSGLDRVGFHPLKSHLIHDKKWVKNIPKLEETMDRLIELKKSGSPITNSTKHLEAIKDYYRTPESSLKKIKCMVGWNNFCVESNGAVKLCHQMDRVGNLRKQKIQDVWHSAEAKAQRQETKRCRENCMTKGLYTRTLKEKFELFFFMLKKGSFS